MALLSSAVLRNGSARRRCGMALQGSGMVLHSGALRWNRVVPLRIVTGYASIWEGANHTLPPLERSLPLATFINYTRKPVLIDGFPMMVPVGDASAAILSDERGNVDGMPVRYVKRVPEALPEPRTDTYYVVAPMVAAMFQERGDLVFAVGTTRSDDGVTHCSSLGRICQK